MIVLDSDHLRVLQSRSPQSLALETRLVATNDPVIATTIVSVEEGLRGWLAEIHKKPVSKQIPYYNRLHLLLTYFSQWIVLPFDEAAAVEYERLRKRRLRSIGTMDLKIAAIVLRHGATLLSANLQHFHLIPELDVQDWIHDPLT